MHSSKKVLFAIETMLTRLGLVVLPTLPRWAVLVCARSAGAVAYWTAPQQRRITLSNLDVAFGDRLSPQAKRRIARGAFYTMALVMLDLFWFARHMEQRVHRYVTLDPALRTHLYTQPMIGVTAHFGNWELLSKALSVYGFAHVAVATPLANPAVDAIIGMGRSIPGVEIVTRQGAIRGLLRALRQKKYVALLLDQNTKPEEGGLFVNFFGLSIPMSTAAAVLSERTDAPVIPIFCRVNANGSYIVYSLPSLKRAELAQTGSNIIHTITQTIATLFEQEIRAHPEQWLWMYKRWKYIDPNWPASAYPFYSKPLRQG
ncbi:MAG: lysophospholipid acyltransferase family protein [Kiritimatiellaeota bacterium]|nr:lysophospholipid acyltransferase family protein [Kiritimatiellota bacterium]